MNWREAVTLIRSRTQPLEDDWSDWSLLEAAEVLADKVEGLVKRQERLITVKGRTLSLSGWARANGIPLSTIHARLTSDWSDEDAVSTPPRAGNFDGKTLQQWSDETGISKGTIYGRLQRGWTLERATGQKDE